MRKLLFLIALLPALMLAQTPEPVLLSITEITVKPGHNSQFVEGVKKWKECYLENKGEEGWDMWHRVQGEGNVYAMTGVMNNWAEMDKADPVSKTCATTLINFIRPHIEQVRYSIARTMPALSKPFDSESKLVWNTFYRVKNTKDFMEIITDVSNAIKDKEGSYRAGWFNYMGGASDSPDFMVSTGFKGFDGLDIKRDGPYKIYEDAVGKKKANEMLQKWIAAVEDEWSYIYTLESELSN